MSNDKPGPILCFVVIFALVAWITMVAALVKVAWWVIWYWEFPK